LPNKVVAASFGVDVIPLLENRPLVNDLPTAYVCVQYACQKPVTDPIELGAQLRLGQDL